MRLLFAGALIGCLTLQGSVLPILPLDSASLKVFNDYIAAFEGNNQSRFQTANHLWIDDDLARRAGFEQGKPLVLPRENRVFSTGSLHHYTGAMRIPGGTIAMVRRVMQDYPNYPSYFRPDVSKATFSVIPDSKPEDEHYRANLELTQSTLWMNVILDSEYDVHYIRVDDRRWEARSTTVATKERVDPKNPGLGSYPVGRDHGFLWRTNTYWFVRERDGGLDMVVDSISLSRSVPSAVAWWGTKRSKDAVEKMLSDTRAAMKLTQVAGR